MKIQKQYTRTKKNQNIRQIKTKNKKSKNKRIKKKTNTSKKINLQTVRNN